MPYYTQAYTNQNYNNYNNYPYHQNYNNYHHNNHNWKGNGWTAMNWANKWYPGWNAYNYKWQNNCWWVYMKWGNQYKTVCIGPNYNWQWQKNGYWW